MIKNMNNNQPQNIINPEIPTVNQPTKIDNTSPNKSHIPGNNKHHRNIDNNLSMRSNQSVKPDQNEKKENNIINNIDLINEANNPINENQMVGGDLSLNKFNSDPNLGKSGSHTDFKEENTGKKLTLSGNSKIMNPEEKYKNQTYVPSSNTSQNINNEAKLMHENKIQYSQNGHEIKTEQNVQNMENNQIPPNNQILPNNQHTLNNQYIPNNNQYIPNNNQYIPNNPNIINNQNVQNIKEIPNVPNNPTENLSPILENLDINATINPQENENKKANIETNNNKGKEKEKLRASNLSVSVLSNLQYNAYPEVKHSREAFANIAGFGVNSYNGKVKNYNEDRIRVIASHLAQSKRDPNKVYQMSYFSIFDGHGGRKCSEFLKKTFYEYLVGSPFFPDDPIKAIREAFKKSESYFFQMAYDKNTRTLVDKSGSCALIMLILDNILYSINLGDSRALYSYNSGKCLLQITRDHKPNDNIEKTRIEKHGGKVYYANTVIRNGKKIELKEEKFGKDFKFPYRVSPGGLAVARTIGDFYAKIPELGGVKGLVSSEPCINRFKVDDKSDFILMGCDGIFDRLENEKIFKKIWEYKKQNKSINDIHSFCGQITDAIIKYSMEKNSVDNVSVVFIAFKNFENKMKDPNFVCTLSEKAQAVLKDTIDFSIMNI